MFSAAAGMCVTVIQQTHTFKPVHLSPLHQYPSVHCSFIVRRPHCRWPALPDLSVVECSSEKTEEEPIQRTGSRTARETQEKT